MIDSDSSENETLRLDLLAGSLAATLSTPAARADSEKDIDVFRISVA